MFHHRAQHTTESLRNVFCRRTRAPYSSRRREEQSKTIPVAVQRAYNTETSSGRHMTARSDCSTRAAIYCSALRRRPECRLRTLVTACVTSCSRERSIPPLNQQLQAVRLPTPLGLPKWEVQQEPRGAGGSAAWVTRPARPPTLGADRCPAAPAHLAARAEPAEFAAEPRLSLWEAERPRGCMLHVHVTA